MGSLGSLSSPSTICKSVWHTPQVATWTRISPGPGAGNATSISERGLSSAIFGAGRTIAFTVTESLTECDCPLQDAQKDFTPAAACEKMQLRRAKFHQMGRA